MANKSTLKKRTPFNAKLKYLTAVMLKYTNVSYVSVELHNYFIYFIRLIFHLSRFYFIFFPHQHFRSISTGLFRSKHYQWSSTCILEIEKMRKCFINFKPIHKIYFDIAASSHTERDAIFFIFLFLLNIWTRSRDKGKKTSHRSQIDVQFLAPFKNNNFRKRFYKFYSLKWAEYNKLITDAILLSAYYTQCV